MIANSSRIKFLRITFVILLLLGVTVLTGWFLGIGSITRIVPGMPSMKFNTALNFVLLAASSLFFTNSARFNQIIGSTLLGLGLLISVLTLAEHLTLRPFGIDELFFQNIKPQISVDHPGRMSAATAICFLLCFLALASMPLKNVRIRGLAQTMLHFTTFVSAVSIFAYLLFVPTNSRIQIFESMAIHTSLGFFVYSIALSLIHADLGFTGLFTGKGKGNSLALKLFIRIVGLITVLSIIQLSFIKNDLVNKEFGVALFGVIFIWVCLTLIRSMSQELNTVDSERKLVARDLQKSKSFFEAIAASLFIVDFDGKILDQNQNALSEFGYSRGELDSKSIQDLIPAFFGIGEEKLNPSFIAEFEVPDYIMQRRLLATRKNGNDFFATTQTSKAIFDGKEYLVVNVQDLTKQEALEDELNINTEKLDIAAEFSEIGFWEYDVLANKLNWGPSMYSLYNLNKEDFTGDFEAWEKSLLPEDLADANQEFADALSGKKDFDTNFRISGTDGKVKYIRAKAKVFKNKEGIPYRVLGTNWDITKEKEAELAIQKSSQQMRIFVEQAPTAIAMFDTEMRYIAASGRWKIDYGIQEAELIGVSHYDIFPEIGEDWKAIHQACLAGAVNTSDESAFKREDGSTQWLTWDIRPWYTLEGEIGGIIMNTANITAQKENILRRLQVEQILEKTNEIAMIGTWELDLADNSVIWSSMVRHIHEAPDDFVPDLESGVNFYKEGPGREAIVKAVERCIKTGEAFDLELEIVTVKGNVRWVRAIGNSGTGKPNPSKLFGVLQDITERKKDEIALNSMLEISNDQNERLRNFAHIVSHNLRSHSGNISMMLDLISESFPSWTEEEMFQMLQTSSSKLRDTITHLNEVVVITGTVDQNLHAIPLRKSVQSCIQQITGTAKDAGVEIQNTVDESISILGLDAYLDSILMNLISNGIKYRSPNPGAYIRISAERNEHDVVLKVTDNGRGIDLKKYGDKIFGMYKTFHGNQDARGIGLFITKNQIESMGGSIQVSSKPGEGTQFTITFNYEKN